jgi:hypothetical protein
MQELFSYLTANHDLVAAATAVAALVVSTISIILAIFNMTTQRTHNRKSLMPIGHVRLGDFDNRIFVELHNDGIGPMLIEHMVVSKNRGWSKKQASFTGLVPALPPGIHWSTFVTDVSGRALSAGKNIVILMLEGDSTDEGFLAARQSVRQALADLRIVVRYRDIYGHKMPPAKRDLNWFAGNIDVGGAVRRKVEAPG